VDVYAAGVIFLEMCHPFGTQMERITELTALQRRRVPAPLRADHPLLADFVLWCTSADASLRPTVEEVYFYLYLYLYLYIYIYLL